MDQANEFQQVYRSSPLEIYYYFADSVQTRLPLRTFSPFTHQLNYLLFKLWQKLRYKLTLWHTCWNCQSAEVQSLMNCWQQWSELYCCLPHVAINLFLLVAPYLACSSHWMLSVPQTFWFLAWTGTAHLTCECREIPQAYGQFLTTSLLSLLDLHLSSWSCLFSSTQASHWCCLHHNSSTRLATITACLHTSYKNIRGDNSL